MTVLIGDFYLSHSTIVELGELKEKTVIEDYLVIQPFRKRETLKNYHRRLNVLAHSLQKLRADMIVVDTDYHIGVRYILSSFADASIKKVVLQSGTIRYVLEAYQKKGKRIIPGYNNGRPKNSLWPLRILKRKARDVLWNFKQWQNFYFFPYWVRGEIFPLTGYERLRFAAGVCKNAICYDPLEQEAVQATNPLLRNVYITRHPMDRVSNERGGVTGRLLVVFSGNLETEVTKEKTCRWIAVINEVVKLKGIREIHLRFHPRLSPTLKWPEEIIAAMKKIGCAVDIVDTQKISLFENLHLYDGMIGAPSGALRVARAMNKSIFILGLPNCSDGDENDRSWILGAGEGIRWIGENEPVTLSHLYPPVMPDNRRPRVSDVLLNLLGSNP